MTIIISLICVLLSLGILYGGFYLAKYVVEKQHRVNVLEDSYRESLEHIASLEAEVTGLTQQLEHMQYVNNLNAQREEPRGWNPRDLLNTSERR